MGTSSNDELKENISTQFTHKLIEYYIKTINKIYQELKKLN